MIYDDLVRERGSDPLRARDAHNSFVLWLESRIWATYLWPSPKSFVVISGVS